LLSAPIPFALSPPASFFPLLPRPPLSTLSPYTTLFRSRDAGYQTYTHTGGRKMTLALTVALLTAGAVYLFTKREMLRIILGFVRSEEHTSELQSRFDLVCRLLLEKKKR